MDTGIVTTPDLGRSGIVQAEVVRVEGIGHIEVRAEGGDATLVCSVLETSSPPPRITVGDAVLVWCPPSSGRAVILGRIPADDTAAGDGTARDVPEEMVIEARTALTLRVGGGSITIREDGKILIKGTDLVSHARRTNRIRGGSVAIN